VDEAALVRLARLGDEAAWELLVSTHQQAVYRLAYLILGEAAEAEDAAQEAFVRAYRALDRFEAERPLRPWLLKITANAARNRRRATGRYLAALRRVFVAAPPARAGTPEAGQEALDAQQLWQATRRLPPADQEVIYLRFFLDLTVAETAQALGVATGTVKSRLHRALERLRQVVEREYPILIEEYGRERTTVTRG
jgi:RNA polymerase sigma-70 factor (ECF subfamily)